ncbi:MAG: cyclodeaminase/cyclohydrolase family protein, partial [Acidimicrobiaceae bacterium]|nr:cyclodeaminase/cyclohydrolase family protein [Acidimicrobiaceae bacterium]
MPPAPVSSDAVSSASVRELVDAVSSDSPAPGGGAVSGVAASLAAALAGMAGRYAVKRSPESTSFRALVARADEIAARAVVLADEDSVAYGRYMEATRLPREPDPEPRRQAMRAALDAASEVPLELTRLAVEVASAGEELATSGNPNLL